MGQAHTTALSWHTGAHRLRWRTAVDNANGGCTVPRSPLARGLVLTPNPPASGDVCVEFGPRRFDASFDRFTFIFTSRLGSAHRNTIMVNVALLDATRTPIDEATCRLAWTEERRVTLRLPAAGADRLHVRFRVSFDRFVDPQRHGSVELRYALAYAANELADLFNSAGSDKGTEPGSGTHGVPHCYALAYEPLLGSLRNRAFSLLEIGLDDESKSIGDPTDAPSLRAWRAFFPKATLYGYDINDFSFVRQPGLVTFQGDQSSREDLGRFLATYRDVTFAVVVDDGSHASADQQISLAALFHRVDPGGLYIVEDLNWQPRRESPTTLEALRAFEADGVFASPFITASEAEYLQEAIDGIEILRPNDSDCAVIRKKQLLAT